MAKQIYILGYVIAIILILSNVKIISANKNNQYATTTVAASTTTTSTAAIATALVGTDDPVAVSSTQQFHTTTANTHPMSKMVTVRSVETTKSISVLHDGVEFMQQTLHNTSSTIDEEPSESNSQKEVHKQVERPQSKSNSDSNGNSDNSEQQRQREYLVQRDVENPKQLLSTMHSLSMHDLQPNPNEKRHNHAQVIQQRNDVHSATPLTYHDKFMNENKKARNAIESNAGETVSSATATTTTIINDETRNVQSNKYNRPLERINSGEMVAVTAAALASAAVAITTDNNDDSRKSDEIIAVPMKIVIRDNVNATSDAVFRVNDKNDDVTKVNKTLAFGNGKLSADDIKNRSDDVDNVSSFSLEEHSDNLKFNERSRYLETDLDDFNFDEVPEPGYDQTDVNVNDQVEWPSDANKFEELTLDDEDDDDDDEDNNNDDDDNEKSPAKIQSRSWTKESTAESITSSPAGTQNILKISKSNKSKSIKRLALTGPLPQQPQPMLEIRLNKSPSMSFRNEKQFINSQSFRYISNLYNQYQWDANELRKVLSPRCSSDMYVYLDALAKGKIWAARGKNRLISVNVLLHFL